MIESDEELQAFFEESWENMEKIDEGLQSLGEDTSNMELVHSLFRALHTLKGSSSCFGFVEFSSIAHAAEDLLSLARKNKVKIDGKLVRLLVDTSDILYKLLHNLAHPGTSIDSAASSDFIIPRLKAYKHQVESHTDKTKPAHKERQVSMAEIMHDDFDLFHELNEFGELNIPHWYQRNENIFEMASHINKVGGSPVDEQQLRGAALVHDIGMAYLSVDALIGNRGLYDLEKILVKKHPIMASRFLKRLSHWEDASQIVLQHHERPDGKGYPYGIKEDIHDGAKILAIADAFFSITHSVEYRSHNKKPIIAAIREINDNSGTQFDPVWVDAFIQTCREMFVTH